MELIPVTDRLPPLAYEVLTWRESPDGSPTGWGLDHCGHEDGPVGRGPRVWRKATAEGLVVTGWCELPPPGRRR